ncbi:MAG: hypothetical protein AB7U73_20505 [Pirellulales bacterium]
MPIATVRLRAIARRLMPRRGRLVLLAMLVVALSVAATAEACPACKQALSSTENASAADPIRGFMWSIVFMMSMPFLLLSGFGTYLWYIVRRAKLAAERGETIAARGPTRFGTGGEASEQSVAVDEHESETVEVG